MTKKHKIKTSNNEKAKEFKCFYCIKRYSSIQSRSNHMKHCKNPLNKSPRKKAKIIGNKFCCRYCKKTYTCKSNIYRHQQDSNAAMLFQGKQPKIKPIKDKQNFPSNICFKVFD